MFSTTDTIVAIATPPGRGGIGVVRVSGPAAHAIVRELVSHADPLEPRHATFAKIRVTPDAGKKCETIDHAIVTFFPAPASYTGDDVVEIAAHGSPVILRSIVAAAIERGARLAQPGEFTLRAFLNGRMDLMQAEAVADLIDAATPLQARAAFDQLEGTLTRAIGDIDGVLFDLIARLEASVDFPEEGYHFVAPGALADAIDALCAKTSALLADARRGRLIRDGLIVAIVGRPNVGKSSLFNALVGTSRAIVAETPGTTRDFVTEVIDLGGLRVTLVDTAGLRGTSDEIEAEGVARSRQSAAVADFVLQVVVDDEPQDIDNKHLIVRNKSDLRSGTGVADDLSGLSGGLSGTGVVSQLAGTGVGRQFPGTGVAAPSTGTGVFSVSARTGAGLEDLRRAIVAALDAEHVDRDRPEITNVRHIALVQRAHDALTRARTAALADGGSLSEEFVLADLQDARAALEEITGRRAPEELLAHIFSRFCIGK